MKTLSIYLTLLLAFSLTCVFAGGDDKEPHYDRGITNRTFIPKGQWMVGATFNYSEHVNDNYQFLILNKWDGAGYTLKVSPFFGYFLKDNLAIGGRVTYQRQELRIDNLQLDLGDDINLSVQGMTEQAQMVYSTFFMRNYISLGKGNRFGIFNEVSLSYGYGQSKSMHMEDGPHDIRGLYSNTHEFNIGLSPGMVAFVNNNLALEVKMDVIGFNMKSTEQIENQVSTGSRRTSNADFNLDIFSLNIGLTLFI
ncbi:hypothetical protein KMW28_24640 [Flammeovirga yaeyamensis]|uniref:Outer membrane protein beta-barrel domain-containing protein n=1 Tax=Flammeovirga yaeyamensis TaxID=367791 RepID=A0AAX1NA45_9BACT|nr:hypothetical protein [Flammeovirga yaeyamensis]MBB3699524.1 hypothetical protein [Flammeovirga yaeyamensis]NMF35220.1 hypothetical protein [Flammeovirga yaeyamensis]QWG04082.1 hypothetical protein KMW28_24640 [Flammeovirga yaeyamensis]